MMVAAVLAGVIGLSLAYDSWIVRVSTTRATLTARHEKCGPIPMSGPKEQPGFRTRHDYFLMARLEDGRLVRVERVSRERPPCGATLSIEERVTPWGSVWYWTTQ
jgi:hypothetical protein